MKKISYVVLSLVSICSLISCGKDSNYSSTSNTNKVNSSISKEVESSDTEKEKKVIVTLNSNGGYLDSYEVTLTYNSPYSLPIPQAVSTMGNVVFEGWYYQGKKIDNQGESFPYSKDITLYGKWESIDFNFRLDGIDSYSLVSCKKKNENVVIPSTYNGLKVTKICKRAFANDKKIKTLSIPNTVTNIDEFAFYNCSSLQSISFTSSVETFNISAFDGCENLKNVFFYGDINQYLKIEFNENANPCCNGASLYFKNQIVKKVTISSTFTTIKAYSFIGVTSLEEVNLPSNLESLGDYSFSSCSNLKKINLPSSINQIGECCFSSCASLTSITIPSNIKSIPYGCFRNCYKLKDITFSEDLEVIENNAFENCIQVETLSFPSKLKEIESSAFCKCTRLKSITFPESLTTISSSAFSYDTSLTSLSLGKNIQHIANGAFSTCCSIESIEISSENKIYKSVNNCLIKIDEDEVIIGCKNSIIPDGIKTIGVEAFFGCNKLTQIQFPSSVTKLDNYSFSNCSSLTAINLTSTIVTLGNNVFTGCSRIESIVVDNDNPSYSSLSNCLLSKDKKELLYGCKASIIPSEVETIASEAFYFCTLLESINIPSTVKTIQQRAFANCYNLKSVTIENGVNDIQAECFSNCSILSSISLPNTITSISTNCFFHCYSLKTLEIKEGVEEIESNAFSYCFELKNLTLPSTLTIIREGCFLSCQELTNVVIPTSNTSFKFKDNMLLDYQEEKLILGVQNFNFPSTLIEILPYALYNNNSLEILTFNDGLVNIDHDACSNMYGLRKIVLPSSIKKIDDYAFYDCKGLEEINYLGTKSEFLQIELGMGLFSSTYVYEVTCFDEAYQLEEVFYL